MLTCLKLRGWTLYPNWYNETLGTSIKKLIAVNEEKKLVRRLPIPAQARDWIAQANRLPRVATY